MLDPEVLEIQRLYPQVYLACHADHVRSSSTSWKLSSHDASILAHMDIREAITPRALAKHLGIAASTLSASLNRLGKLGYLHNEPSAGDKRCREIRLTEKGAEAISATSVLDAHRVRALLNNLSGEETKTVITGLQLLAKAARRGNQQILEGEQPV
ncbi:MAG TPA: MarR family transcriptional regulator [Pyrinomonadaceae bacterium]